MAVRSLLIATNCINLYHELERKSKVSILHLYLVRTITKNNFFFCSNRYGLNRLDNHYYVIFISFCSMFSAMIKLN